MNSFVAKLDCGDVLAIDDRNNGNTNYIMIVTGFYEKWYNNKKILLTFVKWQYFFYERRANRKFANFSTS